MTFAPTFVTCSINPCYGAGWTSAEFLPQERQLFGLPGGFLNDWTLGTNMKGLYVAGDSLFASDCFGHAAATGYYAGRHASQYAQSNSLLKVDKLQIKKEKERIYAPIKNEPNSSIGWKELNMGISKTMQNYCGEVKHDDLLKIGLTQLKEYEKNVIPNTFAYNPHELTRLLEVFDILTVSQLIIESCLARKESSKPLFFLKGNNGEDEETNDRKFIAIKQLNNKVFTRKLPINYFGDLESNYKYCNEDYIRGNNNG